jgi:hypothetical protein
MASALDNEIPNFIKARNPKGLRAEMLKNNHRLAMTIQYFDIQFVNKVWFAWYYEPLRKSQEIKDLKG